MYMPPQWKWRGEIWSGDIRNPTPTKLSFLGKCENIAIEVFYAEYNDIRTTTVHNTKVYSTSKTSSMAFSQKKAIITFSTSPTCGFPMRVKPSGIWESKMYCRTFLSNPNLFI